MKLRHVAGFLFVVFAFNILGEMTVGRCYEICASDQQQVQKSDSNTSLMNSSRQNATHNEDAHICHFGHCSHIAMVTTPKMLVQDINSIVWTSELENPAWRNLAPLLKPPIA